MLHRLSDAVFYKTPGDTNPLSTPSPLGSPLPRKPCLLRTGTSGWGRHGGPGAPASPCSLLRAGLRLPLVMAVGVLISQGPCGGRAATSELPWRPGEGWKEHARSSCPFSLGWSPSGEEAPGGSPCSIPSGLKDTAAPTAHAQCLTWAWPPAHKCRLSLGGKRWTSWEPLFWIGKHFRSCSERT